MEARQSNVAACVCHGNNLGIVIRKLFCDNRRTFIISISVILGFWLALGMIGGLFRNTGSMLMGYLMFAPVGCVAYASMAFSDMKSKEGRLSLLMTPASAWEKFLPRLLNTFFMTLLLLVAGYVLMELGRMATYFMVTGIGSGFSFPWKVLFGPTEKFIVLYFGSVVMTVAMFFYGAILWPKHSFLKTGGVIIAWNMFCSTVLALTLTKLELKFYNWDFQIEEIVFLWLMFGVQMTLTLLFYWLAYRRLKRSTILYRLKQ